MHLPQERLHQDILEVFAAEKAREHGFLRVSAPMVRYSKMEFRVLLRKYGARLCFTPMIIADSFNNSQKARHNEFTTCEEDQPLIAQFAAKNSDDFSTAAQLIYPYVDGVDLNCGCPQSWAIGKGFGCGLLRKPEVVQEIIKTVRRNLPKDFSISLKIRLLNGDKSVQSTVELARQLEKCGATFLSLHGRNLWQRSSDPLNVEAMAAVKSSIGIPLIVNGNVRSWKDACELYERTNADGVMAARGLLANPTLFEPDLALREKASIECVQDWLDIATRAGENMKFQSLHHHLTFMWSNHVKRASRQDFNNFTKRAQVFKFFEERYNIRPSEHSVLNPYEYTKCTYTHFRSVADYVDENVEDSTSDWKEDSNGKFFKEFNEELETRDENCYDCDLEGSFITELYS